MLENPGRSQTEIQQRGTLGGMESTHGTNSILPRHDEEDGAFPVEVQSQVIGVSPVESRSDLMNHKRGFHKHAKFDLMLQYLRQQQLEKHWADHDTTEGVILKRGRDDYICQPSKLPKHINGFFDEARRLNVKVGPPFSLPTPRH